MSAPVASIIIPVWNRADLTRQCLDALGATVDLRAHELFVVDNHSTDETPALLAGHPLAPAVIRNDANRGFARACNQGAAAARGEFLLFLNNDTVPTPGWLEPMVEVLRCEPGVAMVGCRLLYPESRLIQHAGVAFDSVPFHLWCRFPADWPPANVQCDVGAVTAACMLVRRSVFAEFGGFDESYLNGFEDIDLCLRLGEKRHRIVYCPRSVVLHHESMTEGRSQHDERNFALFRERWGERLRALRTSRRDLVLAAFEEVFRINEAGTRFAAAIDRRLFRHDVWPPTVVHFRHLAVLRLAALWLRLRFFFHWRRARRIKAARVEKGEKGTDLFSDETPLEPSIASENKFVPFSRGIAQGDAPDLSVVIPAYGGWALLERCLTAVERELAAAVPPLRAEIVVADDATPGGLPERLISLHPRVRFLAATRNAGFAGNTNRGAAAARGAILCLLNTDMYVEPGWFDACLAPFADDSVFAVCGRILEPSGRNDGYKELALDGAHVHVRTYADDEPVCDEPAEIPYASGGGSFFRRETFVRLGGFDPVFAPFYWEDTDLGYRAWKQGFRILYDPARRVVHDHQGTIGAVARARIRRVFTRNRRRFVLRNQTSVALPRLLWRTTLAPALRALSRLRLGKAGALLAELTALPGVLRARRASRASAARSDAELWERWSHRS